MKDNRLEQRIQHSLNAELSGLNTTSWQRNQFFENATGGTKVKRKLTYSLVLAIVLLLIAATALAVTISYINGQKHIEKAMDISVEFDKYSEWDLDAKIRLIESMREDGIEVSESNWEALHGTDLSEDEKNVLADEILTEQYGEGEYLWFYTIATVDWGEPQTWNLEQRYWFFKTMREKGLYGDYSWIDLLPEDGDLTQEQAENIAKKAVEEAFDLSEEEMTHLHGDVAFFITDECSTPRWQVCLYKDQNVWSTEYTVLLTREGEVTEDPEGLGVWTPVHERQRREERQKADEYSATEWEKTAQIRLNEHDAVYYNPAGGTYYHFLPDCPLVQKENLPLTVIEPTDTYFEALSPCPACVQHDILWSMQDKIKYSYFQYEFPRQDCINEKQALEIARTAMADKNIDVSELYPVVWYQHEDKWNNVTEYVVYFASVSLNNQGEAEIIFAYTVEIDPKTGIIISVGETQSNG